MGFSLLICKKGLSIVVWLPFWVNCSTHTKAPPLILPGPKSVSVGLNLNKAIARYKGLMCEVGYLCVWLLLPCHYFSNPNTATLGNSPSSFMMNILYGCLYRTPLRHWTASHSAPWGRVPLWPRDPCVVRVLFPTQWSGQSFKGTCCEAWNPIAVRDLNIRSHVCVAWMVTPKK